MNQMPYPGPTNLFHIRISGLFFLLWVTNIVMLAFAAESIITNGVGVIILFASEVSGIQLASRSTNLMPSSTRSSWPV
jgi:E3 ubiquitin-protein ligase synoviolin